MSYWYCPNCKIELDGCHVTYEEKCEYCGSDVWSVPETISQEEAEAAWNHRAEQNNTLLALDKIILRCTPKAAELLKNGLLGAVKVCAVEEITPKTNADCIRSMSDEELAVFLDTNTNDCDFCICLNKDICDGFSNDCTTNFLTWLKQPAKED